MSDMDTRASVTGGSLRATGEITPASGIVVTTDTATVLPWECSLVIPQGASWLLNVTWQGADKQPKDVSTGYTAAFVIENPAGGTALVSLTQVAGITLAATMPNIVIALTAAQVATLSFVQSRYTLAVTTGTTTTGLMAGLVRLERAAS